MKLTYLLVNFFSILIPFVFSFHRKIKFNRHFAALFKAIALTGIIFITWDAIFTRMGVWDFSDAHTLGLKIAGMPVEEYLFFICIPFACLFTYHCIVLFFNPGLSEKMVNRLVAGLSVTLIVTGIIFSDRAYTSVTFISTAVLLLIFRFYFYENWLDKLLMIYPFLLLPFFVVNGILTGMGIEEPVVRYNDGENLGIRLGTIPVEDVFYGFSLIMMNLFYYERFKQKNL